MGQEVISKICFVCSDMWEPYLKLIRERCSEALHILDRFHIVSNMNKALDKVRAEETGRMRREGRDPILKKSRWLLLNAVRISKTNSISGSAISSATTSRPSEPTFSRKPSNSSGNTTHRLGPASSSTSGAAKPCEAASSP